ncbi:GntR family transcriptional regulator [Pseudoclavibacter sp. AY1F1]|uniref:FadR/GntR family transcriptional regulator n=1 Tax=Pseudoclavibacter sp. AY1F1 TaxID=2080583 RepID=UPI000CE7D906|nr:FadR/GntR family transcriptional regulator [Pseudoclavibacter sp. AY1F1]PPF45360.1 GntR family transcriptional regulator [Pseudoclavibacter sp. AY1F1]
MARASLVQSVSDRLLDDIISGELPQGAPLPREIDLAERLGVNRLTLREALKTLQAQGVVQPVPGTRGRVLPMEDWTGIEPLLRAATSTGGKAQASVQLVQLRRMIETGACELAAPLRTDADLGQLEAYLEEMRAASAADDVHTFVTADIAFHDVVLRASGNPFLRVLLEPLGRFLYERRYETSAVPQVQVNAIREHAGILEALRSGEPAAARVAMESHMQQTADDLQQYVLKPQA